MEGLGGRVAWHGARRGDGSPLSGAGVYRVNGNLAVARAVGDAAEKPCVSGEPELRRVALDADSDEFIIIASGKCTNGHRRTQLALRTGHSA